MNKANLIKNNFKLCIFNFVCCLAFWAADCRAQAALAPHSFRYNSLMAYVNNRTDVFAAAAQPARLASIRQATVGVFSERRFMLPEWRLFQASAAFTTSSGNWGLQTVYQGMPGWNHSRFSVGYGRLITSKWQAGVQFHLHQLAQSGIYGNALALSASAGFLVRLSSQVMAGASVCNPFSVAGKIASPDAFPAQYRLGLGWEVSDQVALAGEIVKTSGLPVNVQAALHYSLLPGFFTRVGVASGTSQLFAGIGFQFRHYRLDIATAFHQQLGVSPGILLLADIAKNKNLQN